MSGDWIKFEKATLDKPEVIAMAEALEIPETQVVGCLLKVWCWFDSHTESGNAPSVSLAFVNRYVCVSNFAETMLSTGWLELSAGEKGGLAMPGFDTHNSKSARKRALTARRVANHTANASSVSSALAKEEKRRINTPPKGSPPKSAPKVLRPDGLNDEAWDSYIAYRRESNITKLKPASEKKQMEWLAEQGGAEIQARIVDETLRNGWTGLFSLKESQDAGSKNNSSGGATERAARQSAADKEIIASALDSGAVCEIQGEVLSQVDEPVSNR